VFGHLCSLDHRLLASAVCMKTAFVAIVTISVCAFGCSKPSDDLGFQLATSTLGKAKEALAKGKCDFAKSMANDGTRPAEKELADTISKHCKS